jgi:hypothetical protein
MSKKRLDTDQMINDLSTSAFFQQPTKPQVDKTTKPQVDRTTSGHTEKSTKLLVEKYITHLKPATIRAVKHSAFGHERKDYEVMQLALDAYLEQQQHDEHT